MSKLYGIALEIELIETHAKAYIGTFTQVSV